MRTERNFRKIDGEINMEVTVDEVLKEIKYSKNDKAPGPGAINSELLKYGGRKIAILITRLIKY